MRSYTTPLIVGAASTPSQTCRALEPVALRRGVGGLAYDESWMQSLIDRHPTVLPVGEIEPGLVNLVSVCRELPTPSGFVDNLLITPDGGIVVVEAKLWRNPQARREVVGQILDYAKDLSGWTYTDLEAAVRKAQKTGAPLFSLVCGDEADPADEGPFIDRVSRNLRLGRFLCIIAGDGIQESAEQLADFIQRHVGLHFTLAMVELSLWRVPETGDILVQPRVVTRTVQIEREVVRIGSTGQGVSPERKPTVVETRRTVSISREQFDDRLNAHDPALSARLEIFLESLEGLGVWADVKKGLTLKWRAQDGSDFALGLVHPEDAKVYFDYCNWAADSIGRVDLSHRYLAEIAALVGGEVRQTPKPTGWNVKIGGEWVGLSLLLADDTGWRSAIERYVSGLGATLEVQS